MSTPLGRFIKAVLAVGQTQARVKILEEKMEGQETQVATLNRQVDQLIEAVNGRFSRTDALIATLRQQISNGVQGSDLHPTIDKIAAELQFVAGLPSDDAQSTSESGTGSNDGTGSSATTNTSANSTSDNMIPSTSTDSTSSESASSDSASSDAVAAGALSESGTEAEAASGTNQPGDESTPVVIDGVASSELADTTAANAVAD